MAKPPTWFTQLSWSAPRCVSVLSRGGLPDQPGCYVFTDGSGPLAPAKNVLYVGKALSLKERVSTYLIDYMAAPATKHKGKAFIFEFRHNHESRLFVRWAVYGDPAGIEGSLIAFLEPMCNTRWEDDELADDERLEPRLLP